MYGWPVNRQQPEFERSILDESRREERHSVVKRITVMGSLVGLLLYSVAVHSQQSNGCEPIAPKQPATHCGYVMPIYPPKAKAAGIEGTVVVFVQISESGRIDWVRIVSGTEPLRQGAVDAVKSWVYRPILIDGSAHGFRSVIKVNFTIEKPPAQPSPHN
jgi:TonB family protein